MQLRGIDFGHVLDASGVRAWFGEGHSFHRWIPGLSFKGSTFVAKTTTIDARAGNARMSPDRLQVRVFRQRPLKLKWTRGAALNAFGLPGPGFNALLETGRWQQWGQPFFLSFMSIEDSREDSLQEVRRFVERLKRELPRFSSPVGLQVNFSCPNVLPREHLANFESHLNEYGKLGIPIMVKLSAALSVEHAVTLAEHPNCDALCVTNSIAWGELPDEIDWNGLFGAESPLKQYGGGGLSGAPLLPVVARWVREARERGLTKPINAGGGILRRKDVDVLVHAGASSIFIGSMAILRGWRVQRTIRYANRVFAGWPGQPWHRAPASTASGDPCVSS